MTKSIFMVSREEERKEDLEKKDFNQLLEKAMITCELDSDLEFFLYDIAEAIQSNQILLLEQKENHEIAYLIPMLLASQNSNYFNRFIIATSSKEMRDKIIQKLQGVSLTLGITIPVHTLEKEENYLCLRRLKKHAAKKSETSIQSIEILHHLYPDSFQKKDFNGVSKEDWEKIHVKNCSFSVCKFYKNCKYRLLYENLYHSGCILIPHETLFGNRRYDVTKPMEKDADCIIVEESEKLEESVRELYQNSMHYEVILKYFKVAERFCLKRNITLLKANTLDILRDFFQELFMAKEFTPSIQKKAKELEIVASEAELHLTHFSMNQLYSGGLDHICDILSVIKNFFHDIALGSLKYDYSFQLREGKREGFLQLEVGYAPKRVDHLIHQTLEEFPSSTVLTGTIAGSGDYEPFAENCGLETSSKELIKEFVK